MADIQKDNNQFYYGMYRARVENNGYDKNFLDEDAESDPDDINRNRIQVRILGLHPFEENEQDIDYIPLKCLPWAEQAGDLFGGFGRTGSGVYKLPEVESWVWIFFDNGNYQKPVYFASIPGNEDLEDENQYLYKVTTRSGATISINDNINDDEDDLGVLVEIETLKGNKLTLDETKDKNKFKYESGVTESYLQIDDTDGEENITIEDKTNDNKIELKSDELTITQGDKNTIELKGSDLNIVNDTNEINMESGKTTIKTSDNEIVMNSSGIELNGKMKIPN